MENQIAKWCSQVQCSSTVASSRCTVSTTTVNSSVPTCATAPRHAFKALQNAQHSMCQACTFLSPDAPLLGCCRMSVTDLLTAPQEKLSRQASYALAY